MSGLRTLRVWLTSTVVVVLSLATALLASPSAFAGLKTESILTPEPPGPSTPMMLASTGLDVTVPIVIGLSVLVLGTVMVGWAFLATGRRNQQR
ncbi:MAG: hypothetical protein ABJD68_10115 [Nakamurella sp.]